MTTGALGTFLRRLGRALEATEVSGLGDELLLERFVRRRDEAAFEVLVCRHGPLVLGLCRRLLRDEQEAEDAFQATFLALACKARSIARRESLGSWLYKVAYRIALRLRRQPRLCGQPEEVAGPAHEATSDELTVVLDEEVSRLPAAYRAAVVLCYLQGHTHESAARLLGCAPGTIAWRLSWARQRLRDRLARRGLGSLSGPGLLSQVVPSPSLVETTVAAALANAGSGTADAVASVFVEGVWRIMAMSKAKLAACVVLSGALFATALMAWPGPPKLVAKGTAVRLHQEEATRLGVRVAEVRARPSLQRRLVLSGSLAFDPDRLRGVRSRFGGEVVEIGMSGERPLRYGDRVKKGQVLAVVWSKDLGEKKCELIDALVKLHLAERNLQALKVLVEKGAAADAQYRKAKNQVSADLNAVARARRTLQVWRVEPQEIRDGEDEAKRIIGSQNRAELAKRRDENASKLARVEVQAPFDGVIVEKNATKGDIVDTTTDLFKIADLTRLAVFINVHEADAPVLRQLLVRHAPRPVPWQVRLTADTEATPLKSAGLEHLDLLVDPKQRTQLAIGHVENAGGKLRAGQSVTATILVPASSGEVAVPASALVEVGGAWFVFVQPDPKKLVFSARRVVVVRRGHDTAHVRADGLRPGDRVVTAGAVELQAALDDLPQ
jgi:cobalt-zinc-cadmium efflux system membrane fusion protein